MAINFMVDISKHQGNMAASTWSDIANKCEGVILRFGYRGYGSGTLKKDERFDEYLSSTKKYNISKLGIYFFTQAVTEAEARAEADMIVKAVGTDWYYPIYCDTELANSGSGRADKIDKATRTACVKAFCERIKEKGGTPGIYAGTSWMTSNLNMSQLPYSVWRADYRHYDSGKSGYLFDANGCDIWQYSSQNKLLSIYGRGDHLDCNKVFKDFSKTSTTKTRGAFPDLGTATLRKGIIGKLVYNKYVKNLQDVLNTLDYNCGQPDGKFGNRTYDSVVKFQNEHSLDVDGAVGKKTKAKLKEIWSK